MIEILEAPLCSWRALRCAMLFASLSASGVAEAADKMAPHKAPEALAASGQNARVESGKKFFGDGRYAGSDSCRGCHESQYQSWKSAWHSKMERWPGPETVIGDFNDRSIQFKNLRVRTPVGKEGVMNPVALAFRNGNRFFFTLIDKDDPANNQTWQGGPQHGAH